ncbi:3-oxoacyl-ACP synthase, partial [Lactobacillus sp. XV13L]|nr:3-oxoacyl-ACP synthase [Lactobacillus sp. XV13L]
YLTAGYQPLNSAFAHDLTEPEKKYFIMDGRQVYNFATREVPNSILRALNKAKWTAAQVDWWLLHQANGRINREIAKHLKQSSDRFLLNVDAYGNTSAASIPILLDECVRSQTIKRGQKIVLSGFGGGLTVGSIALVY